MIGVTVMTGGGPATVAGSRAFATFRAFTADRAVPSGDVPGRTAPATPVSPSEIGFADRDVARPLHDLAVANDYHPERPLRPTATPTTAERPGRE